jgi:hypothetical protein|tara:strand:- start:3199 stop:3360 length:162 start_codon:yes stop_codon:yes gene_type:complete
MKKRLRERLCRKVELVETFVGWWLISMAVIGISAYRNVKTARAARKKYGPIDF